MQRFYSVYLVDYNMVYYTSFNHKLLPNALLDPTN